MNQIPFVIPEPPDLSDEAVSQILDFLHELTTAFENHYGPQLRRYHDLFDEINDEDPFF